MDEKASQTAPESNDGSGAVGIDRRGQILEHLAVTIGEMTCHHCARDPMAERWMKQIGPRDDRLGHRLNRKQLNHDRHANAASQTNFVLDGTRHHHS